MSFKTSLNKKYYKQCSVRYLLLTPNSGRGLKGINYLSPEWIKKAL
jgi:hypothetical protein